MNKENCLILDAVADDYQTIWEILSVIRANFKNRTEENILALTCSSLQSLIASNLLNIYSGYNFTGEEELIKGFVITMEFISTHKDDWKNLDYKGIDYRFYITELGMKALMEDCKPEYYNNPEDL